jgi:hypothetical protein
MDIEQCEMDSTADFISDAIMKHIVEQSTGTQYFGIGKPSAKQVAKKEAEEKKAEEAKQAVEHAKKVEAKQAEKAKKAVENAKIAAANAKEKSVRTIEASLKHLIEIHTRNKDIDDEIMARIQSISGWARVEEEQQWRKTANTLLNRHFWQVDRSVEMIPLRPEITAARLQEQLFVDSIELVKGVPPSKLVMKSKLISLDQMLKLENKSMEQILEKSRELLKQYSTPI